jgi:hypothetical protein
VPEPEPVPVPDFLEIASKKMHFLPSYSPNLNPIERLWKLMNEEVLCNKYYESFTSFTDAVLGFLSSLSDPPIEIAQRLTKRVTDSFSVIGKAFSAEQAIATI